MAIATPFGVNFRATLAFVTDGSGENFEAGDPGDLANYNGTRGFGYTVAGFNPRDRDAGLDRRLAGTHWTGLNTQAIYRVDLPAPGTYTIRVACGDAAGASYVFLELFDDATSKGVLCTDLTSAAATWKDATNVERASAAAWVSGNVAITATFASTILLLHLGNGLAGGAGIGGSISHLFIDAAGGGGGSSILRQMLAHHGG